MKRILFLFALLVAVSTTAKAETNTTLEATASNNNFVRGYGNSFIFVEGGIEFSVFPDGQFDFYMPNYGPNVNVGINRPGFALSFNTGFNYNPFVQYDSFGAIVQIENTPVFYDFYGRVNQIGNIFINYNGFGRVNELEDSIFFIEIMSFGDMRGSSISIIEPIYGDHGIVFMHFHLPISVS
jgi:hypothetical protein